MIFVNRLSVVKVVEKNEVHWCSVAMHLRARRRGKDANHTATFEVHTQKSFSAPDIRPLLSALFQTFLIQRHQHVICCSQN
jgi:hypothetical protein